MHQPWAWQPINWLIFSWEDESKKRLNLPSPQRIIVARTRQKRWRAIFFFFLKINNYCNYQCYDNFNNDYDYHDYHLEKMITNNQIITAWTRKSEGTGYFQNGRSFSGQWDPSSITRSGHGGERSCSDWSRTHNLEHLMNNL